MKTTRILRAALAAAALTLAALGAHASPASAQARWVAECKAKPFGTIVKGVPNVNCINSVTGQKYF